MKKIFVASFLLACVSMSLMAISPYLKVDAFTGNIQEPATIIKSVLEQSGIGTKMTPFGGDVPIEDLKKYKYMAGMPKFDDPVELGEFGSFGEAVATIKGNLSKGKGSTIKVFEIICRIAQLKMLSFSGF